MEQKHKDLLLKDFGSRLYCGVKVTTNNPAVKLGTISGVSINGKITVSTEHADIVFDITEVKPFLRPMSSMTPEEFEEYTNITEHISIGSLDFNICNPEAFDYLNKKMFDYRGLIPKGLAIEDNPYKE